MLNIGGNVLKNKFLLTLEIYGATGRKVEQHSLLLDVGKRPNAGDYIEFIKENFNFKVELSDLRNGVFTFKPLLKEDTNIKTISVIRIIQDFTYVDVSKKR